MRQAVVIIHGIGEQLPMGTLRGFVDTVVKHPQSDDDLTFYSKPDRISDTLELRRLTANKKYTGENPTDFYELYWQHLMTGTISAHIQAWLWKLLLRRPDSVPRRLKLAWRLMWLLIFMAIVSLSTYAIWLGRPPVVEGIGAVVLLYLVRHLVQPLLKYFNLKYVGDAARYLSASPENVGIRHAIRSAGLDLLRGLHLDLLRRYERIIVVGHSLGSVIAYDVLTYLWQEMHSKVERSPQKHGKPELEELLHFSKSKSHPLPIEQPKLDAVLKWMMPQDPKDLPAMESYVVTLSYQYRKCQRELWKEYTDKYKEKDENPEFLFPWRITDLVTLGSPLTYADFLLANNWEEFSKAKKQREFPTCPPKCNDERDDEEELRKFGLLNRVLPGEGASERAQVSILHHGALFACTRWTNLYFPEDIIGGPLASVPDTERELFGFGVKDVRLDRSSPHGWFSWLYRFPWLYHVRYWAEGEESAVNALRAALDLGEKDQEPISSTPKAN